MPPTPSPGGEGEEEQDNQTLKPLSLGRGVGVRPELVIPDPDKPSVKAGSVVFQRISSNT